MYYKKYKYFELTFIALIIMIVIATRRYGIFRKRPRCFFIEEDFHEKKLDDT